jgi:hypothetical protein
VAVAGNVPPERMVKKVFVFSDMEFDQASATPSWETDYEAIRRKYSEAGYGAAVPQIVFWNLRDSRSVPVMAEQNGVALVSGFSKNMLKLFLDGADAMTNNALTSSRTRMHLAAATYASEGIPRVEGACTRPETYACFSRRARLINYIPAHALRARSRSFVRSYYPPRPRLSFSYLDAYYYQPIEFGLIDRDDNRAQEELENDQTAVFMRAVNSIEPAHLLDRVLHTYVRGN